MFRKTKVVIIKGYGSNEQDAFDNALKVADKHYRIFTSKRIRKVKGENAWNVSFEVYER